MALKKNNTNETKMKVNKKSCFFAKRRKKSRQKNY